MYKDDQTAIRAAYIRGGSSKAIFLHERDIPVAGPLRDRVLKRIMGTPDIIQIDGMGGAKAVTSKIAIIKPSSRPDADVDYTFVQVGIRDDLISYQGMCGNISAGVGPFAIDEGLLKTFREGMSMDHDTKTRAVRIFHTGSQRIIICHVPIDYKGHSITKGDFEIAAVPGKSAAILLDYREMLGSSQGKGLLPSGRAIDQVEIDGKMIDITICDAGNICVFVSAEDLGATGHETAAALTENKPLIARIDELRGKAACLVGMAKDWKKVDEQSPFVPMPILIAPPPPNDDQGHISGRLFLDHMCHESMAGTGAVCFAACSRIKGSVVYDHIGEAVREENILNIAHPLGIMPIAVEVKAKTKDTTKPTFGTLSFVRTARRIMDGKVYVPKEIYDPLTPFSEPMLRDLHNGGTTNGVATSAVHTSNTNIPTKQLPINGKAPVNGVTTNGHKNEDADLVEDEDKWDEIIPVTKVLADFVASAGSELVTDVLRKKIKEVLTDYIAVTASAASVSETTTSIVSAVLALGGGGANGSSTVLTKGKRFTPQYAGLLNANFGHSTEVDNAYAADMLYCGVPTISAALTQAELLGESIDSELFLTAIAVGCEVTYRLNKELRLEPYSIDMNNTSTAGIFGAVATIAVLKKLSSRTTVMAFGLAGSKAAGSLQYLDNGTWHKKLIPGFAVHDAFVCVALAEAGILGATRALEGKFSFLQNRKPLKTKDLKRLGEDLGSEWTLLGSTGLPYLALQYVPAPPSSQTQIEQKYARMATPIYGEEKARQIKDTVDDIEHHSVTELLALLA